MMFLAVCKFRRIILVLTLIQAVVDSGGLVFCRLQEVSLSNC